MTATCVTERQNSIVRSLPHEVVFIDAGVADYQSLIAGVKADVEVVMLERDRDGIEQITQVLANHRAVTVIHLVSHSSRETQLGSARLNLETLDRYAWQLWDWEQSLAPNAKLLIYGCEVAGRQGRSFVQKLGEFTGTAVTVMPGTEQHS